jgi:hypothetical protein
MMPLRPAENKIKENLVRCGTLNRDLHKNSKRKKEKEFVSKINLGFI